MSIIWKMLSHSSYVTYMEMELLVYVFKLKIKESKEIKILKAIPDNVSGAGNMLPEQEMFPAQEVSPD